MRTSGFAMPRLLTIGGILVNLTAALFAGSAASPATRRDLRRSWPGVARARTPAGAYIVSTSGRATSSFAASGSPHQVSRRVSAVPTIGRLGSSTTMGWW